MRKKRRAILEPLDELKHRLLADRIQLSKHILHLRDFNATHNASVVVDVIDELERYNLERLGDLMDRINTIIEEA